VASTNGWLTSSRRPEAEGIRSTTSATCCSERMVAGQLAAATAGDKDAPGLDDPRHIQHRQQLLLAVLQALLVPAACP